MLAWWLCLRLSSLFFVDNLRSHFRHFRFVSMQHLYEVILYDLGKEVPLPVPDTS